MKTQLTVTSMLINACEKGQRKDNMSQLWHYKLQASVKPFL